jgi:LysM repeat protein
VFKRKEESFMSYKPPYQAYKKELQKKRVYLPLLYGGLAIILVAVGLTLIYLSLRGADIEIAFLNTATPTATVTPTPLPSSPTPTETLIPSPTIPPTAPPTATASAPFIYIVQSGDSLSILAERFGLDPLLGHLMIMDYNQMEDINIAFGEELLIPPPFAELFTPTPIPSNISPNTVIKYRVLPGEFVALIAEKCYSTVEDIIDATLEENEFFTADSIGVGEIIYVPVKSIPVPPGEALCGVPEVLETPLPTETATPTQ